MKVTWSPFLFACLCHSPLGLEMWGVLAWSWSATRGGLSAAYRPCAYSYFTNRRRVSMYEDNLLHSLEWTNRRTRRKWSLDLWTNSLQPVPVSKLLLPEVIRQNSTADCPLVFITSSSHRLFLLYTPYPEYLVLPDYYRLQRLAKALT